MVPARLPQRREGEAGGEGGGRPSLPSRIVSSRANPSRRGGRLGEGGVWGRKRGGRWRWSQEDGGGERKRREESGG